MYVITFKSLNMVWLVKCTHLTKTGDCVQGWILWPLDGPILRPILDLPLVTLVKKDNVKHFTYSVWIWSWCFWLYKLGSLRCSITFLVIETLQVLFILHIPESSCPTSGLHLLWFFFFFFTTITPYNQRPPDMLFRTAEPLSDKTDDPPPSKCYQPMRLQSGDEPSAAASHFPLQ